MEINLDKILKVEIPEKLYHYCSTETFMNIMKSGNIRLSDSYQMNDYLENKWIDNILKKYNTEDKYIGIFKEYESEKSKIRPHIFCLSSEKDLLSQWRAYAANGKGISIGFDLKTLKSNEETNENSLFIAKCLYNEKKQEDIIKKIFDEYSKNSSSTKNDIKEVVETLKLLSIIFKNPAFKEENEWRIIFMPEITDKYTVKEIKNRISKLDFRCTENKIISFFQLEFPMEYDKKNDKLPLKEIVLGPKNLIEEFEIKFFLKNQGYNVGDVIKKSKASYR